MIFLVETSFEIKNKFQQYSVVKKELKQKLNLIMAIENEKIVHYKLTFKKILLSKNFLA